MGANFINTILEYLAKLFKRKIENNGQFIKHERKVSVVMSILSNYTPDCLVNVCVKCPIEQLKDSSLLMNPRDFVEKFNQAVKISHIDPYRACTHNKGIFNGIDAVVIATGNDFRAVEAGGHAYAARDGQYRGLTSLELKGGIFNYQLELPLALGTIGGLTSLHPLARISLDILKHPSARELMMITAAMGLAQNFAAIHSLITTGIQKGHMKMHLLNILNQLEATEEERIQVKQYFLDKVVSYNSVHNFLAKRRNYQ